MPTAPEIERFTYSETHNLPKFTLTEATLRKSLRHEPSGPADEDNNVDPIGELWDGDTDADSVHKLMEQAGSCGAITAPQGWEIVIYPREINDGCGQVITVWSTRNDAYCQVVAETSELKDLCSRELWEGDNEIERSIEIVKYVVATANAVAPHLTGAEDATKKVRRHYNERKDGHGHWLLLNQLASDNNAKEDRIQLEREQRFATAEEAATEVERLIAHFHTVYVTENVDADLPVDLGIEHFISATSRLEAFKRSEVDKWSLFEDDQAITLEFAWPEQEAPVGN